MLPVVFVDADVLWSPTLRAWILNFATGSNEGRSPGFELVLTEAVIAEAVARWNDKNPRARGIVVTRMAEALREVATMVRDYDADIPFPGSDDGDIHVHAAAVQSGAGYLVTNDSGFRDLPDEVKDELPYEIYNPDDFLVLVADQSRGRLRDVTREMMHHMAPKDGASFKMVPSLQRSGAPTFARMVEEELAVLAGARDVNFGP
jgi:hypothetical protein